MSSDSEETGNRLLKTVEAIAITPADAHSIVKRYLDQSLATSPHLSKSLHQERVSKKIIARYSRLAATSGGATALAGVVPGIGTAVSMIGGGLADTAVCMKFQVDMCMCLAATYDLDLQNEDARHLSYYIALGGALEKVGVKGTTRIASKAGVKMLRQYLKGPILKEITRLFAKIGITFSRKALEKAIPFGVGVVIGSGFNYSLTKYVGNQAITWFILDRDSEFEELNDSAQ